MNISDRTLFSFFEKPVHILMKPVQVPGLWASKCVQLRCGYVQDFDEMLNRFGEDMDSFFPEKLNRSWLDMFRRVFPIAQK